MSEAEINHFLQNVIQYCPKTGLLRKVIVVFVGEYAEFSKFDDDLWKQVWPIFNSLERLEISWQGNGKPYLPKFFGEHDLSNLRMLKL